MNGLWRMRDGTDIAISDMSTRHIENTLAMLKRKGFISLSEKASVIEAIVKYETPLRLEILGDMAEAQVSADFDQLLDYRFRVHPSIDELEAELARRKQEDHK